MIGEGCRSKEERGRQGHIVIPQDEWDETMIIHLVRIFFIIEGRLDDEFEEFFGMGREVGGTFDLVTMVWVGAR